MGVVNVVRSATQGQKAELVHQARHLLLDQLLPCYPVYSELIGPGTEADVFVYWVSRSGQGGPILSLAQLSKLALLQIEILFDVYFDEPEPASDDE